MFVFDKSVRFEDVDAAGIVFFSRYLNYCHEAMEAMLSPLDGGYSGMIMKRKIGFPAVHVDADFRSPLRYGDTVRVTTSVERIGVKSATLRYEFVRLRDDEPVAIVRHAIVVTDLIAMRGIEIPVDVRALFERHFAPSPSTFP